MSEKLSTAAANFSRTGTPRYRRQQTTAENHPLHPVGIPVPEESEILEKLEQICLKLGRPPTREELVPALRIELNAVFGSLHSALLQLGWTPSCMQTAEGFRRKGWKRKKTGRQTGSI